MFFIGTENERCVEGADGYLHGAPDLCIEVVSPSNERHDRVTKFVTYEKSGVREYWLVDYQTHTVEVHVLNGTLFALQGSYGLADSFTSTVLPMLMVQVKDIFEE